MFHWTENHGVGGSTPPLATREIGHFAAIGVERRGGRWQFGGSSSEQGPSWGVVSKLFVNFAVADDPVVTAFVDLVEGGIGVPPERIFCTSRPGQGVEPGVPFAEAIRRSLDDAVSAVSLISPNYYASAFSMCELGGIWLTAKSFLPILVPPLDYEVEDFNPGRLGTALAGE